MKLYADYLRERENAEVIYDDDGFISFEIQKDINGDLYCYIRDIYVVPNKRKDSIASDMADKVSELVKENGCKYLMGTVAPSTNNSTTSLKVLLGYGFELHSCRNNLILFRKDL